MEQMVYLTNGLIDRIVVLVDEGLTPSEAARRAGVKHTTFTAWMTRGRRAIAAGKPNIQAALVRKIEAATNRAAANHRTVESGLVVAGKLTPQQAAMYQTIKEQWQAKGANDDE